MSLLKRPIVDLMNNDKKILVEVTYATPQKQLVIPVNVDDGITVKDAIELSGIKKEFPEINLETDPVGIFGKHTTLDHILREKDRVEIYRPLIADPKEIRRQRAEQGKKMKKGGDQDG
jgi:putative ubiquitin-RnfH superfamily antitoxin RatB of RatAB toxin-antitoxin module